jgi:hypothetical protein
MLLVLWILIGLFFVALIYVGLALWASSTIKSRREY